MNRFLAGVIGGLLATVPMTIVMNMLFQKLQPSQQYPLPPREITETVVDRVVDRQLGDRPLTFLSLAAHFAYGAATGALYPLFCRRSPHPVAAGVPFGLAIWAASYLGWLPAAHILRPATRHPPARTALMLAAHVVWGGGTVIIGEALHRRGLSGKTTAVGDRA
jgi:hypothetical protein